jgi:hypothetical protein
MRGVRKIVLKARQEGFSTIISGLMLLDTANNPNTNSVIIADSNENAEVLFQMVRRFYDNLPEDRKPKTKYSSKRELVFEELNSTFRVLTAGREAAGRSRTIHNLHCSEVAFWVDSEIFTGLLQAVPNDGNVFVESTANGEGGDFHEIWKAAEKKLNGYDAHFSPWFDLSEYSREVPEDWVPSDEAREMLRLYPITPSQAYWWECKRKEPGMGNKIAQEYPSNPKEAFRVSGTTFFTEWDEDKHVIDPFPVPSWWRYEGANDWGFGKPWAFGLFAFDENGGVVQVDELYEARVLNRDQAARIKQLLLDRNLDPSEVVIHCDPSMWNVKTTGEGTSYRDIDAYYGAGLSPLPANNRRTQSKTGSTGSGGWDNVRTYMATDFVNADTGELYPSLRIFSNCTNAIRTIPTLKHSQTNPEDMESDPNKVEDHHADLLRYLLNAHILSATKPKEKPVAKPYEGFTPAGFEDALKQRREGQETKGLRPIPSPKSLERVASYLDVDYSEPRSYRA